MQNNSELIIYTDENGDTKVEARLEDENIWLTQKSMGELFGVDRTVITKHLKNIFAEGELTENVVSAKFALTTKHGALEGKTQTKETKFYNLDAIIYGRIYAFVNSI